MMNYDGAMYEDERDDIEDWQEQERMAWQI